jgi:hypothetical protein
MPRARLRSFNVFRVASFLLVLYTLGHTLGAVVETPQFGFSSDEVVAQMKSVQVKVQSADCTWYGFYRGFGIMVSVYFAFSALVAWYLGSDGGRVETVLRPIAWALFLGHLAGALITWVYFFPVPIVFSTAITILLGYGCFQRRQSHDQEARVHL